ncbi:MAG TPA: hypothetical protein VHX18_05870 [Rhizomicrobium sp.]|nr:hypothetical protein [Rhizomicrobium sp.]
MSWMAKATLAAALLNCGFLTASADDNSITGQWLKDGDCSLYSAGAGPGDTVRWTGECVDGYAEGLGTATFTHDGQTQSFTANFTHGVIPDGHVITRWGQGWSYDGETVAGRFNGAGILTTNTADRFEGQWTDGKMNGFGILRRANGELYAGDWKDDKPNGSGELRRPDGSKIDGTFVDGKLSQAKISSDTAQPVKVAAAAQNAPDASKGPNAPFGSVSGKTLIGVDGSSIALTLIEGGMELQVVPADGTAKKTTFTFMTDRMGTVVEDSGSPSAGSSVTGFFRLTGKGVEIRYSDGRSAMLSANPDGGVQMALDSDSGAACRAWYPPGHSFSEAEKKVALNTYATRLGLPVSASDTGNGCSGAATAQPATITPATPAPGAIAPSVAAPKARPERHVQAKAPQAHVAKASYHIGDYQPAANPSISSVKVGLESVAVKTSEIHTIDAPAADAARQTSAIAVPQVSGGMTMPAPPPMAANTDRNDASHCLKVDSDGGHWGFRNSCDFSVQFAYCMAGGSDSLTACGDHDAVTTSATGSVAAGGFGALMADNSIQEKDAPHSFRWIACGGGAGEVVAHLDHSAPPAGRCERAHTAAN